MATKQKELKLTQKEIGEYRGKVLDWYDKHGRELPWRYKNGQQADPYKVWLSEIMCQQTTVTAVIPYYTKFLSTWPTIESLANAKNEDVMSAWAGLGYYARARNLHKCAKTITEHYSGQFPKTQEELKKLPGIGDYTSAAIATIVNNEAATVMDGNIERIMSRFFLIQEALPKARPRFKEYTSRFFSGFEERHGDFAQALMDIGSSVCTPKNPKCKQCPIQKDCLAKAKMIQETLPVKIKIKKRPRKYGQVFWITNEQGQVLFQQRPTKGLLAGMVGLPTTSWEKDKLKAHTHNHMKINKKYELNEGVEHVFTHFDLSLSLVKAEINPSDIRKDKSLFWASAQEYENKLPTVFKKAFVQFMI